MSTAIAAPFPSALVPDGHQRLDAALSALERSPAIARTARRDAFWLEAGALVADGDLGVLAAAAHRFDAAGVFVGGPWEDAAALRPELVGGGLRAPGLTAIVEILSELRILAIAEGRCEGALGQSEARAFLEAVLALNLSLVFAGDSEEERIGRGPYQTQAEALCRHIAATVGSRSLMADAVSEIEALAAQRPVSTARLTSVVELAAQIGSGGLRARFKRRRYVRALEGPGPLSRTFRCPEAYADALASRWMPLRRAWEARACRRAMRRTGLVAPQHAALVRDLAARRSRRGLAVALGVGEAGRVELARHFDTVCAFVERAVFPDTAWAIDGLGRCLDRTLLSRSHVRAGLERVASLRCVPSLATVLEARHPDRDPTAVLFAGVLMGLGRPLGFGQGKNPTCQSARGLSLWAAHAPGYLLSLTISAARDGFVETTFDGLNLRSSLIARGVAETIDPELDPLSLCLVPHLDRLYDEMMRRAAGRGDDGHRWVNPAFYGRWVPRGFALALCPTRGLVLDAFLEQLFSSFHLDATSERGLMYPNPVGLCVTDGEGRFLGLHAISLTRVARHRRGEVRAYFFNPNDDGRQNWGLGVTPTVRGHGELPGESSLPFAELASRLYAFHYDPHEAGDMQRVDPAELACARDQAEQTWAARFLPGA